MSTISELMIKIGADASGLNAELKKSKAEIDKSFSGDPLQAFNGAMTGTVGVVEGALTKFRSLASLAAGGFGMVSAIDSAVQAGENVYQLSNRLKISSAEAGELSRVLTLTGGDADSFGTAMLRLDKNMSASGKAGDQVRGMLDTFGVKLQDSSGKMLPLNTQLANLADGYKKASDAGYSQEFLMNTLGTKGLALEKTLRNYSEAAENAAKVKTLGIDPEEMHRMSQEMALMKMQLGQVEAAGGAMLEPLVAEFMPVIMQDMADLTGFLREHKEGITEITKDVLGLVAAYKAMQAIRAVSSFGANKFAQIKTAVMPAAETAESFTLSKSQEKAIKQAETQARKSYAVMRKEAIATAEQMNMSTAEAQEMFAVKLADIEKQAAAAAANVRRIMTEQFAATAASSTEMGVAASAAYDNIGMAALQASVKQQSVTAAMGETSIAAARGAEVITGANTEAAASAGRLTVAETEAGEAGAVAGARAATAQEAATAATALHGTEQELLTAKEVAAGEAGALSGSRTAGAMGIAKNAVKSLGSSLFALAGGWLGVAAAIAYAIYQVVEYGKAQQAAMESRTYTYDGKKYFRDENGNFFSVNYQTQDVEQDDPDGSVTPSVVPVKEMVDPESPKGLELRQEEFDRYMASPEGAKAAAEAAMKAAQDDLAARMKEFEKKSKETGSDSSAAAPIAEAPKVQTESVPIGEAVLENAMSHLGEMWHGDNTADDLHQCAAFASAMLEGAGINGISDLNGDNMKEKAGSAYHEAGTGYVPRAGDIIEWEGHVGVYDGNGGYVARNSTGGVHHGSMDEAGSYGFGALQGYISTADLTGGAQVQRTMDEAGKKALEAAKKIEQAKKDYANLFNTMDSEISAQTDTAYAAGMTKIAKNIQQKGIEINKIAAAGIDTKDLKKKLTDYGNVLLDELKKKNIEARLAVINDTRKALDTVRDDFADEARAEYDITVEKLQKEKDERFKAVAVNKNDKEAQLAVEEWYNAQVLAAGKKRDEALAESHQRWISAMQNQGNTAAIIKDLQYNPDSRKNDLWLDGQKKLAKEYVDLWDKSHESVQSMVATAGADMYNSLSTSMADFIKGTKSAMDVVHDFGNTVLSTIAQIVAQRAAANMVNSLLGSVFGSIGGATSFGLSGGFGSTAMADTSSWIGGAGSLSFNAFADGGIITAPTLGLIGEKSYPEAVLPLTDATLKNIGGGQGNAPQINIYNNSNSNVDVKSARYDDSARRWIMNIVIDDLSKNRNNSARTVKAILGSV